MTWLRTCLFLHLIYFVVSEAPLSCTAVVYFCIKHLQWYLLFYFLTWGKRERDHTICWVHILQDLLRREENYKEKASKQTNSPKITFHLKPVFRDVPSWYQVSGCPKTWDWLPTCHVPQKLPTLSSPTYTPWFSTTCSFYYLLLGSRHLGQAKG